MNASEGSSLSTPTTTPQHHNLPPESQAIDYDRVGAELKANYRDVAERYRLDDEVEVTTENHRGLCELLGSITSSFKGPIDVLDVGCGTGRYFHCLHQVRRLVGLDLCEEMLEAARHPVMESEVTAQHTDLICSNVYYTSFPPASFDLIYSLGMFGHGCPVTVEIMKRFHDLLRPGGILLFNVVDTSTLAMGHRLKLRLKSAAMPYLPRSLRLALEKREQKVPFCGINRTELQRLIAQTPFVDPKIRTNVCKSPLWKGTHLICTASKTAM